MCVQSRDRVGIAGTGEIKSNIWSLPPEAPFNQRNRDGRKKINSFTFQTSHTPGLSPEDAHQISFRTGLTVSMTSEGSL